jgi:hypothetical protein
MEVLFDPVELVLGSHTAFSGYPKPHLLDHRLCNPATVAGTSSENQEPLGQTQNQLVSLDMSYL